MNWDAIISVGIYTKKLGIILFLKSRENSIDDLSVEQLWNAIGRRVKMSNSQNSDIIKKSAFGTVVFTTFEEPKICVVKSVVNSFSTACLGRELWSITIDCIKSVFQKMFLKMERSLKKEMPIALCADNKYIEHCATTMASVLYNISDDYIAHFYILNSGLTDKAKVKLNKMGGRYKIFTN